MFNTVAEYTFGVFADSQELFSGLVWRLVLFGNYAPNTSECFGTFLTSNSDETHYRPVSYEYAANVWDMLVFGQGCQGSLPEIRTESCPQW